MIVNKTKQEFIEQVTLNTCEMVGRLYVISKKFYQPGSMFESIIRESLNGFEWGHPNPNSLGKQLTGDIFKLILDGELPGFLEANREDDEVGDRFEEIVEMINEGVPPIEATMKVLAGVIAKNIMYVLEDNLEEETGSSSALYNCEAIEFADD